jgi:hypothetical protein
LFESGAPNKAAKNCADAPFGLMVPAAIASPIGQAAMIANPTLILLTEKPLDMVLLHRSCELAKRRIASDVIGSDLK